MSNQSGVVVAIDDGSCVSITFVRAGAQANVIKVKTGMNIKMRESFNIEFLRTAKLINSRNLFKNAFVSYRTGSELR